MWIAKFIGCGRSSGEIKLVRLGKRVDLMIIFYQILNQQDFCLSSCKDSESLDRNSIITKGESRKWDKGNSKEV